jgi:hypothetical protein
VHEPPKVLFSQQRGRVGERLWKHSQRKHKHKNSDTPKRHQTQQLKLKIILKEKLTKEPNTVKKHTDRNDNYDEKNTHLQDSLNKKHSEATQAYASQKHK